MDFLFFSWGAPSTGIHFKWMPSILQVWIKWNCTRDGFISWITLDRRNETTMNYLFFYIFITLIRKFNLNISDQIELFEVWLNGNVWYVCDSIENRNSKWFNGQLRLTFMCVSECFVWIQSIWVTIFGLTMPTYIRNKSIAHVASDKYWLWNAKKSNMWTFVTLIWQKVI